MSKNDEAIGMRYSRRRLLGSTAAALLLSPGMVNGRGADPIHSASQQPRSRARTFGLPSLGMESENQAILLAIDDSLLTLRRNLCYYLTKPQIRKEPVLAPNRDNARAPDYASADLYGSVVRDGDRYRMWYLGGNRGPAQAGVFGLAYICYAESADGLRWTKPVLNQVSIEGSRNNNAIAIPDPETEGVNVIKDDADPDPRRRYKMIYQRYQRQAGRQYWTIRTATSPNGVDQWNFGPKLPVATFIEFSSLYRHGGLYIVNAQTISPFWRSEGGHASGRQGVAWVSADFNEWLPEAAESFFLPEPAHPQDRGGGKRYDQVHLGVGAVSFGNVLVGLYCNWRAKGSPGDGLGFAATSGDLGLVVSNDGLRFREPVKGHVYIAAADSRAQPSYHGDFPTILEQNNSIINVGDETRIYHGRWLNLKTAAEWYGEIALATIPRDRWGALGLFPEETEGSVLSAPVTLPAGGCRMVLNADDATGMRVDLTDEQFKPLEAYAGANGGTVDECRGLDCVVRWKRDLANLGGKTVRVRIHLRRGERSANPRLYALYLRA